LIASTALIDSGSLIEQLGRLSDEGAQLAFLRRNRQLRDPAVVALLYEEVVKLVRADVQQADRLAQAADWIAKRLQDDSCSAQALRARGHVQLARGKYNEAVQSYEKALLIFRRLGRDPEVGRTLYGGSLQALIYLGQYDKALAWAQEARRIFQRLGDRLRLARLDSNSGNILYRQDRFEEALECYRRALEEFKRRGELQDIAITLRNIAVCHISLADFGKALETYQQGRAHCEQSGMPLMVVECDYNIAYLYFQRGEYARAIALYQSTRKQCEALGDPYHEALCDLDQSEMYVELNLDEEGAQLAARAAASFHRLKLRYEEAKALTFRALATSRCGSIPRALILFAQARRLFAEENNRLWSAFIDLYQATVLYRDGSYDRARRLCLAAFSFFSASALESKAALCELLLARLHLQSQDLSAAHRACAAAIAKLDETEAPVFCCHAHFIMGQIREAQRDYKAALQSYQKAHALLEDLRSHLKTEDVKIAFLKDKLAVYESLVWLCLRGEPGLRERETALAYIEQAKSRSLADLIAFRAPDLPMPAGPRRRLSERVRKLRKELNWHYRRIETLEATPAEQAAAQLERLHRRKRGCEDRLVRALSELGTADQDFGVLQGANTIGLDVIRSSLPADVMLLEYYQAREVLYACVIGRHILEIVPLTNANSVRNALRLLQFQLSKFRLGTDYIRNFEAALRAATHSHLRQLYEELIAPVWAKLQAKHLVIVPHDFLHYLPFHALHDGSRFLIDKISISYSPSASVYHLCCSKPDTSLDLSLILGIPDSLTPHVLEEARNVASLLPNPHLFIGKEATEKCLRVHGPKSRFVHIAAHGLFRQDNPMFSSMRLGDSQISLLDLYSLKLSSELVTLSGCSTGLNTVVGGDEMLGLVRGLLFAGTRAVLVSLWDIDDKSTADFMRVFYGCLASNPDKGLALQKAMQEMREVYPHPYFWAPFVLIGKVTGRQ
jgi:CHAT domain-containing protein/Tfp pilus assembly protein PilF